MFKKFLDWLGRVVDPEGKGSGEADRRDPQKAPDSPPGYVPIPRGITPHGFRLACLHESGHVVAIIHSPLDIVITSTRIHNEGGVTDFSVHLPSEKTVRDLWEMAVCCMGGAAGEIVGLGRFLFPGCINDFAQAIQFGLVAQMMLQEQGRPFACPWSQEEMIYLPEHTDRDIVMDDAEIRFFLMTALARATWIVSTNREELRALTRRIAQEWKLSSEEIAETVAAARTRRDPGN